jgi:hypothetical protein
MHCDARGNDKPMLRFAGRFAGDSNLVTSGGKP